MHKMIKTTDDASMEICAGRNEASMSIADDLGLSPYQLNAAGYFPAVEKHSWVLSVDLGQVNDYTAISIIERVDMPMPTIDGGDWMDKYNRQKMQDPVFKVVYLYRFPLGTTYFDIRDEVVRMLQKQPLKSNGCKLVIDKTGIGIPIAEIFKQGGLKPIGITVTSGGKDKAVSGGYHVAKINLIGRTQGIFQARRLKVSPKLKEGQTLVKEMQNFVPTVSPNSGNVTFAARSGGNDDLVLSVSAGVYVLAGGPNHMHWSASELALSI